MSKLGVFKSFLNNFLKPASKNAATFKGSDLLGNKYFEISAEDNKSSKPKRFIGSHGTNLIDINVPKIPSQWEAWLRFQRDDPPSLDELKFHEQRIDTIQKKAKQLELKYDKEREELIKGGMISGTDVKSSTSDRASSFPIREEYETQVEFEETKKKT